MLTRNKGHKNIEEFRIIRCPKGVHRRVKRGKRKEKAGKRRSVNVFNLYDELNYAN